MSPSDVREAVRLLEQEKALRTAKGMIEDGGPYELGCSRRLIDSKRDYTMSATDRYSDRIPVRVEFKSDIESAGALELVTHELDRVVGRLADLGVRLDDSPD